MQWVGFFAAHLRANLKPAAENFSGILLKALRVPESEIQYSLNYWSSLFWYRGKHWETLMNVFGGKMWNSKTLRKTKECGSIVVDHALATPSKDLSSLNSLNLSINSLTKINRFVLQKAIFWQKLPISCNRKQFLNKN